MSEMFLFFALSVLIGCLLATGIGPSYVVTNIFSGIILLVRPDILWHRIRYGKWPGDDDPI